MVHTRPATRRGSEVDSLGGWFATYVRRRCAAWRLVRDSRAATEYHLEVCSRLTSGDGVPLGGLFATHVRRRCATLGLVRDSRPATVRRSKVGSQLTSGGGAPLGGLLAAVRRSEISWVKGPLGFDVLLHDTNLRHVIIERSVVCTASIWACHHHHQGCSDHE